MPTSKSVLAFFLEQLGLVNGISFKPMMGEVLLYRDGLLFGGIYDSQLLVKKTETNAHFELTEVEPYPNAKLMYAVDDVDDKQRIMEIVLATCEGLQ